jgi:beta-1,2-mannobiose phosphorylase / 1,2-beta-oligomannan phosphorylase
LDIAGYDGTNARDALATSKNLKQFKKHGIIVPPNTYSQFVFLAESGAMISSSNLSKEFHI